MKTLLAAVSAAAVLGLSGAALAAQPPCPYEGRVIYAPVAQIDKPVTTRSRTVTVTRTEQTVRRTSYTR